MSLLEKKTPGPSASLVFSICTNNQLIKIQEKNISDELEGQGEIPTPGRRILLNLIYTYIYNYMNILLAKQYGMYIVQQQKTVWHVCVKLPI